MVSDRKLKLIGIFEKVKIENVFYYVIDNQWSRYNLKIIL